jgi:hypothetical protein
MAKDSDVPQPGPARLSKGAGPDEWLEQAKQCKYLPEAEMKRLCEIVKECLMEGKFHDYVVPRMEASMFLGSSRKCFYAYGILMYLPRIKHPACEDARHRVR